MIVEYRELLSRDLDKPQSKDMPKHVKNTVPKRVSEMVRNKFKPSLFAGLTTGLRSGSLVFSGIQPIISFGWMMIALSILGIFKLNTNNSFINYFRESTTTYRDLAFIDQEFGGSVTLGIIFSAPQNSEYDFDQKSLSAIQSITEQLNNLDETSKMTMTIAAVAIGISVDDTIHYVHRYLKEKSNTTKENTETHSGKKTEEYIKASHLGVGYALLYTTLIIGVEVGSLIFSDFMPSVYFGFLASVTMLIALLCDLTLLPALLNKLVRKTIG